MKTLFCGLNIFGNIFGAGLRAPEERHVDQENLDLGSQLIVIIEI